MEWEQEDPNTLLVKWLDKPVEVWRAGTGYLNSFAKHNTRTPAGHPEGYLEAFANVYTAAYADMIAHAGGQKIDSSKSLYPNVNDGVDGMNFITQCVASSKENGAWRPLKHAACRS